MPCFTPCTWNSLVGLTLVTDLGSGIGLHFEWGSVTSNDDNNQVHYLIYSATTRFDVFNTPLAITTALYTDLAVFTTGQLYYLGVRATEFDPTEFDLTELTQIGYNSYSWPAETTLTAATSDAYGTYVNVSSTEGYPSKGYLLIGTEVMYFTVKEDTSFYVEDVGRGAYSTTISSHDTGESVKLFTGPEDLNTVIMIATPTFFNESIQNNDAIGQYGSDEDGYKVVDEDILTTNLTAADDANSDFPEYDYCGGYHSQNLVDFFKGDECLHSYAGGRQNGFTNFNLQEQSLQRLEMLLQTTGEPMVLLKRKWEGRRCSCFESRKEHPRNRKTPCYNTGFVGGYDRFVNTRSISTDFVNTQGYILVRISPYPDLLELSQDQGLRENVEITAWTLAYPTIKQRDVICSITQDMNNTFRYFVTSVTRNKTVFGLTGRQELKLKRIDFSDYIYTYDIEI